MLKGDLTSTPLASLLLQLADDTATGCLHVIDSADEEALVYLKDGLIYSVSVPGNRPQLGAKLVSSGALAPEALAEALDAQRTELQGWRLGELLVHLGYVDQPVVEAFVREQVSEALWDLLRWSGGTWKFRRNVKAREDIGPPLGVVELLETLRERGYEWETISAVVHGPNAVPKLSTHGETDDETVLDNDAWSMLCKIDSERSVADLANDCGYTMYEAGQIIVTLVQAGLVDIEEEIDVAGLQPYGATTLASALAGELDETDELDEADETDESDGPQDEAADVTDDALSRLARLVSEVASEHSNGAASGNETADEQGALRTAERARRDRESTMTVQIRGRSEESFAASIARVSRALSDVLGDEAPTALAVTTSPLSTRHQTIDTNDPAWQRRQRLRSAAAAELATAQAMIESLRLDHDAPTQDFAGEIPRVVTTEAERQEAAAREAEQAARHAAEEAARQAAEQFARAAADEAQRLADEQEAQRLAAEQAAEQAAEEAQRLAAEAAEREAAEEALRLAAAAEEAAVAERVRVEREAAEERAWAEYWQREETAREAAEAAERAAAEEAERLAAVEAERRAAEEAEHLAVQEAERAAAAEAARAAAEEAEAAERREAEDAERAAAEAAEREAAELAETLAAEAEERAAAEAAERQAALEAEQAAAAAAEAAAVEEERAAARQAEQVAAEEADRRADEAAAATALLIELAASDPDEKPPLPPEIDELPDPDPEPTADAADDQDRSTDAERYWGVAENTDTAALLRELSSLGVDDEDEPAGPATPSRPHRPRGPEKKPKKKIGLFGL